MEIFIVKPDKTLFHTLTSEEKLAAKKYADNFNGYSNWQCRNQDDLDKAKLDNYTGVCGEIGAYRILKRQYPQITHPDILIYDNDKKSFKQDMQIDAVQIHVKCQDISMSNRLHRGLSWTAQFGDNKKSKHGHDNHIFASGTEDWFCGTQTDGNTVTLHAIISLNLLHANNLFEDPEFRKYNSIKKCIYLDSLILAEKKINGNI